MTVNELLHNLMATLPELILGVGICAVILADMLTPAARGRQVTAALALLAVVWGLTLTAAMPAGTGGDFGGMLARDGLARVFKLLFLTGAASTILFSLRSRETIGYRQGEFHALVLGATLGACLLAAADNIILLVLALETLSISSYVLAGYVKHERRSAEAALKYLLYGAVASGIMLFGFGYLYGMSGTTSISTAAAALAAGPPNRLAFTLALLLVLVGFGFKMAMVPFHFWCPDVYQGAPTPVTAYLAVVSKAAGFAALMRVLLPVFEAPAAFATLTGSGQLALLFGILAAVTMLVGNFIALHQTDIKRLLAYSSIAHAGYLLMGFTVFSPDAAETILFYFVIYLFMNLGAFWCAIVLIEQTGSAELDSFRGAAWRSPFLGGVMFIFLISLTGLPPTAGFVAKLRLFEVVLSAGMAGLEGGAAAAGYAYLALAIFGVLNSAVSLYYYMKIMRAMAFERPAIREPIDLSAADRLYALLFAVPTVALLFFTPVLRLVDIL
ncbi:MAG TPA: NADH-quinone oxidoreductase subunit N [Candidatus Sumerlaeota bacterium]|nr:NADH-quinone oxidoreductase subunit N [Candidatus Sumerlaeota bacterium]